MTCPQLIDSGVYVLGALSPSQRMEFERHMAGCAECQAEVNELAVLPGLLGRVDEPTAIGSTAPPPAPPTIMIGAVRRARRIRRARRMIAIAAGLAIACLALVAGLAMPRVGGHSGTPQPVALHAMRAVVSDTPITADVGFTPITGGTRIDVTCRYPTGGGPDYAGKQKFDLFVEPRSGAPAEQVSSWWASPGETVSVPGITAWSTAGMADVELRDDDGQTLLVYSMS